MNFKVGDRVECIRDNLGHVPKGYIGTLLENNMIRWDKKLPDDRPGWGDGYHSYLTDDEMKPIKGGKPQKKQQPTHIVVWDTGCGDPHKFCVGLAEVKEKILELTKDTDVIQDSIIVCKVNQITKPTVKTSVDFKAHKI